MKCTEIRQLLPDLATGLMPVAPEVNDHLRSCADCAAMFADYCKTMALLDEWQAPEPSLYFDTRLKARLREASARQPHRWLAWLRRPVLAVSMALVLVAGVTVFRVERTRTSRVPTLASVQPGTAVGDLQELDKNHDLFSDSDPDSAASLLDDMQVQQDVNANP
jgi:predicted anti-sigma-YlaC factor YlaD